MKLYKSITVDWATCPRGLKESIVRISPEAGGESHYYLEAKPGDDRAAHLVDEIFSMCKRMGLDHDKKALDYRVVPVYEAAELDSASLLLVWAGPHRAGTTESSDSAGQVGLPASQGKLAAAGPAAWREVSDNERRILELGRFLGLSFGEVGPGKSVSSSPTPVWRLKSTVTLPAMTNAIPRPYLGPARFALGGRYGEPHYLESELSVVGAFDIASTMEELDGAEHLFVVTQRFYQHCRKHQISLEVRLCRIKPG